MQFCNEILSYEIITMKRVFLFQCFLILQVFKNLALFMDGKSGEDELFDRLTVCIEFSIHI